MGSCLSIDRYGLLTMVAMPPVKVGAMYGGSHRVQHVFFIVGVGDGLADSAIMTY